MKVFFSKVWADVGVKVVAGVIASVILAVGALVGPSAKTVLGRAIPLPVGVMLATVIVAFGAGWCLVRMRLKASSAPSAIPDVDLSEEAIIKGIQIGICGDGEGMAFWKCGPDSSVRIWLLVRNYCPFEIEIDRIVGKVKVNSPICDLAHLKRVKIKAHSEQQVYTECSLSSEALQKIAFQRKHQPEPLVGLDLTAYAVTPKITVTLLRSPGTANYRFHNFDLPEPKS